MEESLAVLECLLPEYFTGVGNLHQVTDFHMRNTHGASEGRRTLSREAAKIMTHRLSHEFSLYDFIKTRLLKQYKDCKK